MYIYNKFTKRKCTTCIQIILGWGSYIYDNFNNNNIDINKNVIWAAWQIIRRQVQFSWAHCRERVLRSGTQVINSKTVHVTVISWLNQNNTTHTHFSVTKWGRRVGNFHKFIVDNCNHPDDIGRWLCASDNETDIEQYVIKLEFFLCQKYMCYIY